MSRRTAKNAKPCPEDSDRFHFLELCRRPLNNSLSAFMATC